ncbi:hypothetical protein HK104_011467 [Borealophlyctis nickersoniae]|nr:hypothetical protein HK104_011467 [Borealophlyctis nickersoniae]
MEDVLSLVARDHLPPASALTLKRTGKTLAAVISENILLRSLANHIHSTRNTDPEKYLRRLRSDKQTAFVTSLLFERGVWAYEEALGDAAERGNVKTVQVFLDFLVKNGGQD